MTKVVRPKVGEFVWVHYDGKGGRYCPGICTSRSAGEWTVHFLTYSTEPELVSSIFVRKKSKKIDTATWKPVGKCTPELTGLYTYLTGIGEVGIMRGFFGMKGDYYVIYNRPDLIEKQKEAESALRKLILNLYKNQSKLILNLYNSQGMLSH